MKNKKIISIKIFCLVLSFFFATIAINQAYSAGTSLNLKDKGKFLDDAAKSAGYNTDIKDPVPTTIARIINVFLGLLGIIFLCFMIYAGFLWMTASGEEEKVKKAQKIIKNSIIGLIIVIGAYGISYFVLERLSASFLTDTGS